MSVNNSKSQGLIVHSGKSALTIPAIIADVGDRASKRFLEFFTANIRNPNTRAAYKQAVSQFLKWCQKHHLSFHDIEPVHVAAYIEYLRQRPEKPLSDPSVKQHLAAIRMLLDWMVTGQIVAQNPAACVRGPKHVVEQGKTMVLSAEDARTLLDSIAIERLLDKKHPERGMVPCLIGLRDRAVISVMAFTFARISAVLAMNVEDYYANGKRWWLRLHEKGSKYHQLPAHHLLEVYLDAYIQAAGIRDDAKGPLIRSAIRDTDMLTDRPLRRNNALDMIIAGGKGSGSHRVHRGGKSPPVSKRR